MPPDRGGQLELAAAIGAREEAPPYAAWRWMSLVAVSSLAFKSWPASASSFLQGVMQVEHVQAAHEREDPEDDEENAHEDGQHEDGDVRLDVTRLRCA
jgi:hypothetical protein